MLDLRLAIRALRCNPVIAIVAIVSLALGIGANTAIFSLLNALMLRPLPVQDSDRLFLVTDTGRPTIRSYSYPVWNEIHRRPQLFGAAMAWSRARFLLGTGVDAQPVDGIWASGSFFATLGVPAALGRLFAEADDRRGGGSDGPVAVISYGFWQRQFGGAADAVDRMLTLNSVPFRIVGVTPRNFFGADVGRSFDVIVPLADEPLIRGRDSWLDPPNLAWLTIMARLTRGQTMEAATAALRSVQTQIRDVTVPVSWSTAIRDQYLKDPFALVPGAQGNSTLRRRYQRPLLAVMAGVALLLLMACANIANLLLARAAVRRHEMSLRLALGASRWRLIRQLLTESCVLATTGAAGGIVVAPWITVFLIQQLSTSAMRIQVESSVDARILVFTVAVTAATAVLCGIVPAFRGSDVALVEGLNRSARGVLGDGHVRTISGFVALQVALSVVVLVGAGLLVRTFTALTTRQLGFDPARVLVVDVTAPHDAVTAGQRIRVYERALEAARTTPGATNAAVSFQIPISGPTLTNPITEVSGGQPLPDADRKTSVHFISPGWLSTIGIPLSAGREFTGSDRAGSPPVAIVNRTFARRFLSGRSALGHSVTVPYLVLPTPSVIEIVGVVADAVDGSLREPLSPTMYVPLAQYYELPAFAASLGSMNFIVRTNTESPLMLTKSVAAAITAVYPDVGLVFRALGDQIGESATSERLIAILSIFFGGVALLLAALGLYGLTAYAVARRRTEIAVRLALGSSPNRIVRLLLSRLVFLVATGIVMGAFVTLWATTFVSAILYGVDSRDPTTFAIATAVIGLFGTLACWLPAWRVSRLDPGQLLRDV